MLLHESCEISRQRTELEAESVAWIFCDQLGIDSSEYTFGYVASWLNGTEEAIEGVRDSRAWRSTNDPDGYRGTSRVRGSRNPSTRPQGT